MTFFKTLSIGLALIWAGQATAQHQHHAKHGMILMGEQDVFASHIVYKVPHNYQVLLRLRFGDAAATAYATARDEFPRDRLVFVLDAMDLSTIDAAAGVTGTLARDDDATGARVPIQTGIALSRADYDVLFFNELPLSLAP